MLAAPEDVQTDLDQYTARFRKAFRRRDQFRWMSVYLQGLVQHGGRKNIEGLAGGIVLPAGLEVDDVAQTLRNFISQSPWDEQEVWRRYRALVRERIARPEGTFVISEVAFVKQGRHSVGVQRQYSSGLSSKVNCQIALAVAYVSPAGAYPLALRLYLPAGWLNDPHRLAAATVPEDCRRQIGRAEFGLRLLDEVRAEGFPGRFVVTKTGLVATPDVRTALAERGLSYLTAVDEETLTSRAQRETSARPWQVAGRQRFAWHPDWLHAGDPDKPSPGLLRIKVPGKTQYALGSLPSGTTGPQVLRLWNSVQAVDDCHQFLKDRLGLDHFEGRSWRGFHHHACLVMLGYAFLNTA